MGGGTQRVEPGPLGARKGFPETLPTGGLVRLVVGLKFRGASETFPSPRVLRGTMATILPPLWDWQRQELDVHGNEPKRAVYASPRLGKSRVGAEGLRLFRSPRNLVIAPLTVCPQWRDVLTPIVGPVQGLWGWSGVEVRTALKEGPDRTLILPDSILAACIEELLKWLRAGGLIVDESHRFAGVSTKRGRAMRKLALQAGYVRLLSGTPTPNHAGNLWGQMYPLAPELWGRSYERFAQRFLIRNPMFPTQVYGVRNSEELREMLLRNASIVRREDVFGPDTWQEVVRHVDLAPSVMAMYNTLARRWVLQDPDVTVENAATRLLRLQQLTSGHLPDEGSERAVHSAKIDACIADLEEIVGCHEKAVIFYRFRLEGQRMLEAARRAYPGATIHHIGGETHVGTRDSVFEAVLRNPGPQIAVVQTQAGGIGRSFAEAKYALFLSEDFSFAAHEQARDRVYKPGARRVVTVYRCRGTVDDFVGRALASKRSVHEAVRNSDRREWAFGHA